MALGARDRSEDRILALRCITGRPFRSPRDINHRLQGAGDTVLVPLA
jgi:hypothetical protein